MSRKRPQPPVKPFKKKPNPLKAAKVTEIDYKDVALLRKFISDRGKIRSRRITARLAKAVATREDAVAAKAAIEGTTVEIAAKVSESGKLFGSVTAEQIALALSDKAAVNPKAIEVEPIKTTGDFPAKAALHPEITASFFVKVVAE